MNENKYKAKGRETIDSIAQEWNLHSSEVCNTLNDICNMDMRKGENRKKLFDYIEEHSQYSYYSFLKDAVEECACNTGLFKIPEFVLEYPHASPQCDLFTDKDFIIQNIGKFKGGFKKGFYILATNIGLTEAINCKPKKMLDILNMFVTVLEEDESRSQYAELFRGDDGQYVFDNAFIPEGFRAEYGEVFGKVKEWIV